MRQGSWPLAPPCQPPIKVCSALPRPSLPAPHQGLHRPATPLPASPPSRSAAPCQAPPCQPLPTEEGRIPPSTVCCPPRLGAFQGPYETRAGVQPEVKAAATAMYPPQLGRCELPFSFPPRSLWQWGATEKLQPRRGLAQGNERRWKGAGSVGGRQAGARDLMGGRRWLLGGPNDCLGAAVDLLGQGWPAPGVADPYEVWFAGLVPPPGACSFKGVDLMYRTSGKK